MHTTYHEAPKSHVKAAEDDAPKSHAKAADHAPRAAGDLLTLEEAAKDLGIDVQALRALAAKHQVKLIRADGGPTVTDANARVTGAEVARLKAI